MTLEEIYNRLDLQNKDCLFRQTKEKDIFANLPMRIARQFSRREHLLSKVDAIFCFDNKPLVLFYDNIASEDKQALHKEIWNFNESPIVIIVTQGVVEVFNGLSYNRNNKLLDLIGGEQKIEDYNYANLVSGKSWSQTTVRFSDENRIDYCLLRNIDQARKILCEKCKIERNLANALLGKVIFIRYLIDRKVNLKFPTKKDKLTNELFCNILKSKEETWLLFCSLQDKNYGFGGDLFPINHAEMSTLSEEALDVLVRLLNSEQLSDGQQSLFDLYDFSILPIEFISSIYERFVGGSTREDNGAYYTPLFLASYIVEETVGKKLKNSEEIGCKVLDPACGSGIFLIETLRLIIEKYLKSIGIEKFRTKAAQNDVCKLVKDNLFGIDKDESAIHVAIFSIYLTLLDYQTPADIVTFKFPKLYSTNLIVADTFDKGNQSINNLIAQAKDKPFDVVLGNPPWRRGANANDHHVTKYIESKQKSEPDCCIANGEVAQSFLTRSLDFAGESTECALIVTSKVLYNVKTSCFRQYFLKKVSLRRVFELASTRKEVFCHSSNHATAPACIIFYGKAKDDNEDNLFEYISLKPTKFFSLFKSFMLTSRDIQYVQKSVIIKYDWLWKVLVYGSWLDFCFINRLQSKYETLFDVFKRKNLIVGEGVIVGNENSIKNDDAHQLIGRPFLSAREDVQRFYVRASNQKFNHQYVIRRRKKELFEAPCLLVKRGISSSFRATAAIMEHDAVYTHALTGVKGKAEDVPFLLEAEGLLNSSLLSYYALMLFSSSGIEREQIHDVEKWAMPYTSKMQETVGVIRRIINLKKSEDERPFACNDLPALELLLDKKVCAAFDCSDQELSLIDYATKIIIPQFFSGEQFYPTEINGEKDPMLEDYVRVFLSRFNRVFNSGRRRLSAEIVFEKNLIGVWFRVVESRKWKRDIEKRRYRQFHDVLNIIQQLTSDKITEKLFVRKDLRGFNTDSFYIFKPNERRLWHKAVAYVDVEEFADAIFRAGLEE